MYKTVNEHDFIDSFIRMGRAITNDNPSGNFTIDGLRALFEWLEDMEAGTNTPIELDVIGLCCEFAEHDNVAEAAEEYDDDPEVSEALSIIDGTSVTGNEDAIKDAFDSLREWFEDRTTLIEFDDGVIIGEF